jgi:hypothetical protein
VTAVNKVRIYSLGLDTLLKMARRYTGVTSGKTSPAASRFAAVNQTLRNEGKLFWRFNMNKKMLGIALILLTLVAVGMVFAAEQVSLSWSGSTVTARNPNRKTELTGIQICVVFKDGDQKIKEFTSKSFDLAAGKLTTISAPGEVISASAVTCQVLFDRD